MEPHKIGQAAGNRGKGRPKGAVNKTTASLKSAILAAAEQHGKDGNGENGLQGYLFKVASEDVKAFSSLLGRVLPMDVTNSDNSLRPVEIILVAASDQSND